MVASATLILGLTTAGVASASVPAGDLASAAPAAAAAGSSAMTADLHKLRICESGDNYREDTGNGYYGAYQFAPSTWKALGFNGRPDRAKAATQNHAARKLHREAGWSAWPSCSHTEHLR
jgi:Transglycosylase-like domain